MNEFPVLGRLVEVNPREAWRREDHVFTPWLAANIDRLGDVIGMTLEVEGIEQSVERFSADILARDIRGERRVLIENQLEVSDHTHLGQIMTYLAGLETEVMVWVAPEFRAPHLSVIRWLNEHTEDPFSFFAVRVRLVRIGASDMAPLFEIIEQPNNWDREVAREAKALAGRSALGDKRFRFWSAFLDAFPQEGEDYSADAASSRWKQVADLPLKVVQYVARHEVGIFIRPDRGILLDEVLPLLDPCRAELEERLGASMGKSDRKYLFATMLALETDDEANWPMAFEWLHRQGKRYCDVLMEALENVQ